MLTLSTVSYTCQYLRVHLYVRALMFYYAVEILPYGIRAKGFAIMVKPLFADTTTCLSNEKNICIQFALAFDQFVNPIVLNMIGWKYVSASP